MRNYSIPFHRSYTTSTLRATAATATANPAATAAATAPSPHLKYYSEGNAQQWMSKTKH